MYYDRLGTSISEETFNRLMMNESYCQIGWFEDESVWVSTVWIGYDPGALFLWRPPRIFETMINWKETDEFFGQWRYVTQGGAAAGHEDVIRRYKNGRLEYAPWGKTNSVSPAPRQEVVVPRDDKVATNLLHKLKEAGWRKPEKSEFDPKTELNRGQYRRKLK